MKQTIFTVKSNLPLAPGVLRMELEGDTSDIFAGQFVNIKLEGFYLRRPISVCDVEGDILTLVYKTVGEGTCAMSALEPGAQLDILTGLGNGYDTSKSGDRPLLVGGGVGTPPLYLLCRRLLDEGKKPRVALGFNSAQEIFLADDFAALGVEVGVTTVDGSFGSKGFVTQLCTQPDYTYIYACGPMPMLRALNSAALTEGQFSLEERMGCGFGACMGCSIMTTAGSKRVCKDGPVFERSEIIWQTQE